jgi:endonuclease/exonuclease/phosphatase family metal-dependent hydrolase
VRIATWNVRHGRPTRGFTSNRRLAAAVTALDVDVLAVQEVERRVIRSWFADQPADVARAMGAGVRAYAPARRLALTGSDGIALCSRVGIDRSESLSLPHAEGQPRVALLATIRGTTIVTTHLQNEEHEARRQLAWLLDRLATAEGACVLLGDLNLRPADIAGMVRDAGFTSAGGGFTNPATEPVQQIDHVLVRGLEVDDVVVGPAPVSDHRPLVATVGRGVGSAG